MGRILHKLDPCITIAGGQLPGTSSEPWWSDEDGIGGAHAAATRASLNLATKAAAALDSVVEAVGYGSDGNSITIAATGDSATGAGVSIAFGPTANDVTVHFEDGVSTVDDVEDAIDALAGKSKIIQVKTTGTAATVLHHTADHFSASHLAGGVNPGHNVSGHHVDGAIVRVKVSNWGSLAGLRLVSQRMDQPDGLGAWDYVEPVGLVVAYGGEHLTVTGGKVVILAALGTGYGIAIEVRSPGAKRLRFGLVANDAGSIAAFACTAGVEFFADSVQS